MGWDPADAVRRVLLPGEAVLWAGRQGRRSQAARAVPTMAVGAFFMALSGFATRVMLADNRPDAFETTLAVAFGLFSLIGLALLVSGAMVLLGLAPVAYAVTDRRLLIVKGGLLRKVSVFAPQDIQGVESRERADGSGSLVFRQHVQAHARVQRAGFLGIADVRAAAAAVGVLRGEGKAP